MAQQIQLHTSEWLKKKSKIKSARRGIRRETHPQGLSRNESLLIQNQKDSMVSSGEEKKRLMFNH